MLRRWRGRPHGGAPEAAAAGPRGVGGGPPSLRSRPRLESAGVSSAAVALPSPRVACETCVAWGIEPRTTRVARGPRTTCGVRACGAGGRREEGKETAYRREGGGRHHSGGRRRHAASPRCHLRRRCRAQHLAHGVLEVQRATTRPGPNRQPHVPISSTSPAPWPCRRIHACEEGEKGRGDRMGRRGRGGGRPAWEGEGEERSRPRGRRGVATSPCLEDTHAG
jgi:hypothetical protein